MSAHLLPGRPGEAPVEVVLRRSKRARRISLRVSSLDGRVTLTVPARASEREALAFAQEKSDWIRANLARQPAQVFVGIGAELPLEGEDTRVQAARGRRIERGEGGIDVPADLAAVRLERYLRELARERLTEACDFYAGRLGRSYTKLTLRDTRSRWGSCSYQGALMFSWRLILAPKPVLRYVAAHEVAHLAEMNHSRAFWDTVERIHGPYEAPRRWLKTQGNHLHRFRFDGEDDD